MMNKSVDWRTTHSQTESGWQRRSAGDAADVDRMIGRRLKTYYGEVQSQPLPAELTDLLRALDEAEGTTSVSQQG